MRKRYEVKMAGWENTENILLEKITFKNKTILDVGCGNGWFSMWTHEQGASDIYAIDPIKDQIDLGKSKNENINFDVGTAENMIYEDDKFDLVFFFNSLHHVPKTLMKKSLNEAQRVVKKLGYIFIVEPIAEGDFNEILKIVDDEKLIRLEAYNAINEIFSDSSFVNEKIYYDEIKEFQTFINFSESILSADPNRKNKIEENKDKIESVFNELSIRSNNKYTLLQPMRMNVIKQIR